MNHSRTLLTVLLVAAPVVACNALTGADNLVIDDDFGEQGSAGSQTGNGAGATGTGGAATTGTGAGATGTGTGGSTATGNPPPDPLGDALGVGINEIAVYQGVKRQLMANGAAVPSTTPVVAGRDALIRVFASDQGGYDGGPVVARLFLNGSTQPYEVERGVSNPSEGSLNTTFNFDVPGADLAGGFSYRVELKQAATPGSVNPGAVFPASGFEQIGVQSSGAVLKISLVPVSYGADGSNRLPDTSPGQLQAYEELFYAMYPVPSIEISVHAPMAWSQTVANNGNGWDTLLNAVADLRANEGATDVYYYGIFSPAASVGNYCGGGCVAGLGFVGGPTDNYTRAAIGLGFSGTIATETAVHEVGHNHGRNHSPCGGAAGADQNYPYPNASIGSWGYNLLTGQLFSPSEYSDVMGYCSPIWVSDYTYKAIFNRIKSVNGANVVFPQELLNRTYDRVRVDPNGGLTWMDSIQLATPPMGEEKSVVLTSETGSETVTGQYYEYDHLPGGVLFWPASQQPFQAVQIQVEGKSMNLTR
jgi:hypothetical protein